MRQIDFTAGAGLMILGVIISLITAITFGGRSGISGMSLLLITMAAIFGLLVALSWPSPRRRGLNGGIVLVFLSALIAMAFARSTEGMSFLIVGAILIPIILSWSRFMRFLYEPDPQTPPRESPPEFFVDSPRPAIPISRAQTTANLPLQQIRSKESNDRFSVTEDSTALLKNKLP